MANAIDPEPRVETLRLTPDGGFPNHPALPLLLYRQAGRDPRPAAVERALTANRWGGTWRNGVYPFHHFHSNAHEVLVVCSGEAELQFGGPAGPVVAVRAGDAAVLPAGTAHCRRHASDDFLVVGAYPPGQQNYDLRRGDPDELAEAAGNLAAVPLPDTDPLYGPDGPLLRHWRSGRQ